MKRSIYIILIAVLAVAIVSSAIWLITGKINIVTPILGAIVAVILSIRYYQIKSKK